MVFNSLYLTKLFIFSHTLYFKDPKCLPTSIKESEVISGLDGVCQVLKGTHKRNFSPLFICLNEEQLRLLKIRWDPTLLIPNWDLTLFQQPQKRTVQWSQIKLQGVTETSMETESICFRSLAASHSPPDGLLVVLKAKEKEKMSKVWKSHLRFIHFFICDSFCSYRRSVFVVENRLNDTSVDYRL